MIIYWLLPSTPLIKSTCVASIAMSERWQHWRWWLAWQHTWARMFIPFRPRRRRPAVYWLQHLLCFAQAHPEWHLAPALLHEQLLQLPFVQVSGGSITKFGGQGTDPRYWNMVLWVERDTDRGAKCEGLGNVSMPMDKPVMFKL